MYYEESNYLVHHGILGQKWGVRRYQNPDGSLTEKGKRRAAINDAKADLKKFKKDSKAAYKHESWQLAENNDRFLAGREYKRAKQNIAAKRDQRLMTQMEKEANLNRLKRGDKGELATYTKWQKKYGISGSAADEMNGGYGTKVYDHVAKTKGKEFADKVETKARNQALGTAAAGAAIAIGAEIAYLHLNNRL